jgi:FkbM family methyltransferase
MARTVAREALKEIGAIWRIADTQTCVRYVGGIVSQLPRIIRERKLAPADTTMSGRELTFRVMGCDLRLSGEYFSGARELWGRRVYFARPGFSIKRDDIVMDLGANVGLFSLLAAARGAHVVAVEMQSGLIPIIEANLRANRVAGRVNIVWGIVGARSGTVTDRSMLDSASHYFAEAPVLSIAEIIRSHNLRRIDFLKVDIEGSEFDLFSSQPEWLRIVQKIAMEIHCKFGDPASLVGILKDFAFDVSLVENRGSIVQSLPREGGYLFAQRPQSSG